MIAARSLSPLVIVELVKVAPGALSEVMNHAWRGKAARKTLSTASTSITTRRMTDPKRTPSSRSAS